MKLILVRHGNTFNPGEKAYWVGSKQDLPLTVSGCEQAVKLAERLHARNLLPQYIYSALLTRTKHTAQILKDELNFNSEILHDSRLNEIDYGLWSGLTDQEIKDKFGDKELNAWQANSDFPSNANWGGTEQEIISRVNSIASDIIQKHPSGSTVLLVSSNGILRYFLKLVPGAWEEYVQSKKIKVATGNYCMLEFGEKGWWVGDWNS